MHRLAAIASHALALHLPAQNTGLRLTNGVDSFVDVPYAPSVAPRSGITVEAWITYDDSTLGAGWRWPTIVRQNSTPQVVNYMLRIEAGTTNTTALGWTVRTPIGTRTVAWRFVSGQLNTWTHVAATYDGQSLRILVNGAEVAQTFFQGGPLVDTPNTLRIGNGDLSAPGIEEWNGEIDEVRLWPFARTAAEIASTMNHELSGVPGDVSTWNFNGNLSDSSGTNHGTPVNSPTIATNTLSLTPLALRAANFGMPTAGCAGSPRTAITNAPRIGNADFALATLRATIPGSGLLWLGTRSLSSPIVFLGVSLFIDPTAPNVQVPIVGGGLALSRVPLAIPTGTFLVSRTLMFQTVWIEPGCAVPLFAADGLAFTILR